MTLDIFRKKWKTCYAYKEDVYIATIFALLGCVCFWNLRCHKTIKQINNELRIMTPENLNRSAWLINIALKSVGVGYLIKAGMDYKKC